MRSSLFWICRKPFSPSLPEIFEHYVCSINKALEDCFNPKPKKKLPKKIKMSCLQNIKANFMRKIRNDKLHFLPIGRIEYLLDKAIKEEFE